MNVFILEIVNLAIEICEKTNMFWTCGDNEPKKKHNHTAKMKNCEIEISIDLQYRLKV